MIVTADLDLSECDRVDIPDGQPDSAKVLIYGDNENAGIGAAVEAIARCRLIAERHAFKVEILPAVSMVAHGSLTYYLPAEGSEVLRTDGKPVSLPRGTRS